MRGTITTSSTAKCVSIVAIEYTVDSLQGENPCPEANEMIAGIGVFVTSGGNASQMKQPRVKVADSKKSFMTKLRFFTLSTTKPVC